MKVFPENIQAQGVLVLYRSQRVIIMHAAKLITLNVPHAHAITPTCSLSLLESKIGLIATPILLRWALELHLPPPTI